MSQFDQDNTKFIKYNNDLINYYYFENGLDKEMIEKLKNQLKEIKPKLYDGNTSGVIDKTYRESQIWWIPKNKDFKWLYDRIGTLIKNGNDNMWNFDITHMNEEIQYAEYHAENAGHYDWHVDIGGASTSMRKISISIQLSDPEEYEGGELQFFFKRNTVTAPKTKGTAILFPSFMLHRVTPITKGTRKSLVLWVSGPPFK